MSILLHTKAYVHQNQPNFEEEELGQIRHMLLYVVFQPCFITGHQQSRGLQKATFQVCGTGLVI